MVVKKSQISMVILLQDRVVPKNAPQSMMVYDWV